MKIVTISGASGSGKSTVADFLNNKLASSFLFSIDRYYIGKTDQMKNQGFCNFDNPAAIDGELLREHLALLKAQGEANMPIYDFTISERKGFEKISAKDIIIIEGLFAGSLLSKESDLNIFVESDLDIALIRRINRDINERGRTLDSVLGQYIETVRPAYFKYIEPIKSMADVVILNDGAIDHLENKANEIIESLMSAPK